MATFLRTQGLTHVPADHLDYREAVRADFRRSCAYCLIPEPFKEAKDFQIDHFMPQRLFSPKRHANNFLNLYYACAVCNRTKWKIYDPLLQQQSKGYYDLCADRFEHHVWVGTNLEYIPLTPSAQYTIERLRLNRTDLVQLRRLVLKNAFGQLPELVPPQLSRVKRVYYQFMTWLSRLYQ